MWKRENVGEVAKLKRRGMLISDIDLPRFGWVG
jgi:hypothetical protein